MKLKVQQFALLILLTIILCGCSGGHNPVSTIPGGNDVSISVQRDLPSADNHFLWMYSLVYVDPLDPESIEVELIPFRDVAAHWNVLGFLEQWPCTDCLRITYVRDNIDRLRVGVQLTHPFTSLDLTGFDVRGIIMFNASREFPVAGLTMSDGFLGDAELLEPDGYTTLYNPTTIGGGPGGLQGYMSGRWSTLTPPNATLNAYMRFESEIDGNTRNAFIAGTYDTVYYDIDKPDGPFVFGYAVDACWERPINSPVTDPMTDFGPGASSEEPWQIRIIDPGTSEGLNACGGEETLLIEVYDWQGKSSHFAPILECPEIFDGQKIAEWIEDDDGYSIYEVTFINEKYAAQSSYLCLVGVEDVANDPVGKPWLDLTAYQVFYIPVAGILNLSPVAVAAASTTSAWVGELITFDGSGSYDGDCDGREITQWEWDWENDGAYDEEGVQVDHSWDTGGLYEVRLKVTDDEGTIDRIDEPLLIEVRQKTGWVHVWNEDSNWADEIASDAEGNIYVAGLGSGDSAIEAALRKVSPDGVELWSNSWGGSMALSDGVAVDDAANAVYVTGYFGSSCDFDPGPGEDIHEPLGLSDIFLSKFTLDGDFVWAHTWGGDFSGSGYWYERGHGVAIDSSGNVYTCGIYKGTCDFDPGQGTEIYTSAGGIEEGFDAYLSKFNSDGDFQWARVWGTENPEADSGDIAFGVTCGQNDDVYVVGGFLGTVDFDPGPGTNERTSSCLYGDYYLLKWDLDGDYLWVRSWSAMGMSDFPGISQCWGGSYVTTDADYIYCVGAFNSTVDFNPGVGDAIRNGPGGFLSKFDTNGDFIWVDAWLQPRLGDNCVFAVAVDAIGDIYSCGFFSDDMDMDPGPDEDIKEPPGQRAAFLCKVDSSGSYLWSLVWGPEESLPDLADGWSVTTDPDNSVYCCGPFRAAVDFDPGPGVEEYIGSNWSAYLVKYTPDGTW